MYSLNGDVKVRKKSWQGHSLKKSFLLLYYTATCRNATAIGDADQPADLPQV